MIPSPRKITPYEFQKLVGTVFDYRIENDFAMTSDKQEWFNIKAILNDIHIPMFDQNDGTRLAVVQSRKLLIDATIALTYEETPDGHDLRAEVVSAKIDFRFKLYRFLRNLI